MKRTLEIPRKNWETIVESQGMDFHTPEGKPYWDESVSYSFSRSDISKIRVATNTLWDMCLEAVQYVFKKDLFYLFRIPSIAKPMIIDSWENETPSIYGRFDLAYDGTFEPKMLEFNAMTPTSLLEAAAIQWAWNADVHQNNDQFNNIEENLLNKWKDLLPYFNNTLYFTCAKSGEDYATMNYLATLARQIGIPIDFISIGDIGWDENTLRDLSETAMRNIFTLYPFECMLAEQGRIMQKSWGKITWMEPPWKLLLTNKAILAVLWDLFPNHPYLLETHLNRSNGMVNCVRKPFFSREGANVSIFENNQVVHSTPGQYGEEGFVYQETANLFQTGNQYAVIGSWYVTDYGASGIGIRESDGPITDNLSRFVPHFIE